MEHSLKNNSKSWRKISLDGHPILLLIMSVKSLCFQNGLGIKLVNQEFLLPKGCLISITLSLKNTHLKGGKMKWKVSLKDQGFLSETGEESILFQNFLRPHVVLVDGGVLLHKVDNSFNWELLIGNNMLQSRNFQWSQFIIQMNKVQYLLLTLHGLDFWEA